MEKLRTIQLAQLDMALEVKRLCEKHNIQYFLLAGTALGAIRHKGFIPWDDDLDIGMLREDYDKFRDVCQTELDPAYFYQDMYTDPGYGLPFAKLRINGTVFEEVGGMHTNSHHGIFIDIFPFDKTAFGRAEEERTRKQFYLLFRAMLAKQGYLPADLNTKKKVSYTLLKAYPMSVKRLRSKIDALVTANNSGDSPYAVTYGGSYGYWKERVIREWFESTRLKEFEGIKFPVPGKVEEYLTSLYGDYMQLPPEEKRGDRHRVIEADLGDYRLRT